MNTNIPSKHQVNDFIKIEEEDPTQEAQKTLEILFKRQSVGKT